MRRIILALWLGSVLCVGSARAQGAPGAPVQPESPPSAATGQTDTTPTWSPPAVRSSGTYSYSPERLAVERELVQVDLELARLRSQRPGVALPILLVVGGYTVAAVTGLMSLAFWGDAREHHYGWDERGNRYRYVSFDEELRAPVRATAALMGLGLIAASAGVWLLVPRVRARRALRRVMNPLEERRRQLVRQLSWAMNTGPDELGVTAKLQF